MYEAHRSWQLPGQYRADIIMYAARNRIRLSPLLLAAWARALFPCTLALRRERSSKRQRLLVKAAGREDRVCHAGIPIRTDL